MELNALYQLTYLSECRRSGDHYGYIDVASLADQAGYKTNKEFGNYNEYKKVLDEIEQKILDESEVLSECECNKGGSTIIVYRFRKNTYLVYRIFPNGLKCCLDVWRDDKC